MDYQLWGSLLLLTLAVGYCSYRMWSAWKKIRQGGCSSSCGCPSSPSPKTQQTALVQENDLTARLRTRIEHDSP